MVGRVIERYTRPAMGRIWSEDAKYQAWLRVEVAVCEAYARRGRIPARCHGPHPGRRGSTSPASSTSRRRVKHEMIALLTSLEEQLGADSRFVHVGLTTNDVWDTATALQLRDAADLLIAGQERLRAALAHAGPALPRHADHRPHPRRARRADHVRPQGGRVVRRGRSQPGAAAAGAGGDRGRQALGGGRQLRPRRAGDRGRGLPRARPRRRSRSPPRSSSATGTRSSARRWPSPPPRWRRSRSRSAGCSAPRCWRRRSRSARDRRARARCRTSATRSWPSASAGWPGCCAATRWPPLENVALWHERDISHSSVERVILPDSTILLDYVLDLTTFIVEGLDVDPARMAENLEAQPRQHLLPARAAQAHRVRPGPPGGLRAGAAPRHARVAASGGRC